MLETCWGRVRGAQGVRGGPDKQQHQGGRSGRRRRRTLCTVAVIAACAAASLPSGAGFVAPSVCQTSQAHILARGLAVVGQEEGSRRAGRRRRAPVGPVHMVSQSLVWFLHVRGLDAHTLTKSEKYAAKSTSRQQGMRDNRITG